MLLTFALIFPNLSFVSAKKFYLLTCQKISKFILFCFIILQMMKHAWEYYKLYAWGKNELRPISKRPHTGSIFGTSDLGATIIDGLDTLYLMNLTKEFNEGRDWIARRFTLENVVSVHRCFNRLFDSKLKVNFRFFFFLATVSWSVRLWDEHSIRGWIIVLLCIYRRSNVQRKGSVRCRQIAASLPNTDWHTECFSEFKNGRKLHWNGNMGCATIWISIESGRPISKPSKNFSSI